MKYKSNYEMEEYYFNSFKEIFQIPEGVPVHRDKPDFIIDGKYKIGIELTNYYIKDGDDLSSEQHKRCLRDRVVNNAHKKYLQEDRKSIEVSFSFSDDLEITNPKTLTSNLLELGRRLEMYGTGSVNKDVFRFIPELHHVYVNQAVYNNPKWNVQQVYQGNNICIKKLGNILREKEEKLIEYIDCDEYWLLIVVNFMDMAQDQEIMTGNLKLKSDMFRKVILYRTVLNNIVELQ